MDLFRRLLCGIRSALCPEQHESPDSDHGIRVLEYHSDDSRARSPFACGSGSRAHEAVEIGQVFVRCRGRLPFRRFLLFPLHEKNAVRHGKRMFYESYRDRSACWPASAFPACCGDGSAFFHPVCFFPRARSIRAMLSSVTCRMCAGGSFQMKR